MKNKTNVVAMEAGPEGSSGVDDWVETLPLLVCEKLVKFAEVAVIEWPSSEFVEILGELFGMRVDDDPFLANEGVDISTSLSGEILESFRVVPKVSVADGEANFVALSR